MHACTCKLASHRYLIYKMFHLQSSIRDASSSRVIPLPWNCKSLDQLFSAWARLPRQSRQQRIHATGIQNSPKGTLNTSADVANITIRGVPCKPRKSWRRRRLFPPGITLSSGGLEPSRRLSALASCYPVDSGGLCACFRQLITYSRALSPHRRYV